MTARQRNQSDTGRAAPDSALEISPPSEFFTQHWDRIRLAAQRGPVVDLACGRGRHTLAAAAAGLRVIGIDRKAESLAALRAAARQRKLRAETVRADFESDGIPLRSHRCGAILVFRYLHRPLAQTIAEALAPGGLLVYETFTVDHSKITQFGPRNPEFLLRVGELPELFANLEIIEHWEGICGDPQPAAVARLLAQRQI